MHHGTIFFSGEFLWDDHFQGVCIFEQNKLFTRKQLSCQVVAADHVVIQPHFTLSKWASLDDGKCYSREVEADEDKQKKSYSPQLRRRGGPTHFSGMTS